MKAREIEVNLKEALVGANLAVPDQAIGIVAFAHGSGSGRFSPRNQFVARHLQEAGIATLLLDLLTSEEEQVDEVTRELRFDIKMLGRRVEAAVSWIQQQPELGKLPVGLFGASTGAAAALVAAARAPKVVKAVVSRGGRPDLAREALGLVRAPTLLIVGGADLEVIELNREALEQLNCEKKIDIVPGAGHLFEEPGTLEAVASLARAWFVDHLVGEKKK
jgi:putative phosphoribosyl transferase